MNKEKMKDQLKKVYEMWEDGEILETANLLHELAKIIIDEVEADE